MSTGGLERYQERYERALREGDVDAVDDLLDELPADLRPDFHEWARASFPLPETTLTRGEVETRFVQGGVGAEEASFFAGLVTSGGAPTAAPEALPALLQASMEQRGVDEYALAESLVSDLGLDDVEGAAGRVRLAVGNVLAGRAEQAARFAPQAVDALARVLGAPLDGLRTAFEAAAAEAQGSRRAMGLARASDENAVLLDAERAAEHDDRVDELFFRQS